MSLFLSNKAVRLLLAISVSIWMAGGCLFGCSNAAMAADVTAAGGELRVGLGVTDAAVLVGVDDVHQPAVVALHARRAEALGECRCGQWTVGCMIRHDVVVVGGRVVRDVPA